MESGFLPQNLSSSPKPLMASASEVKAEANSCFIGAGCNRVVNNVSWGACDLVSFGAQNSVAIFSPKTAQIVTTLPGHRASVNCTHWLPTAKFAYKAKNLDTHYLLSGDADGVMIMWEYNLVDNKWKCVLQVSQAHKKGVTCITAFMISGKNAIAASTSSDGIVNMWEVVILSSNEGGCKLSALESLSIGSKPMVALSLAELPGTPGRLVLAMAGLDNKIHLYCGERSGKFVHACNLKGHTDWIRSLDFSLPINTIEETSLLLVSSSQDKGIRIWKITVSNPLTKDGKDEISLATYIKGPVFEAGSSYFQTSMESLIIGHEDWVYSVEWQPPMASSVEENEFYQPQSILSASMDKTMMIWQPEKTTGIWINVVTVGELGHCALGFFGGHWSPKADSILAHGYGGSFHLWKNVGVDCEHWKPQVVPSGHFASVSDIVWARGGEYVLSVSHDQTTRIFAPWPNHPDSKDEDAWHEIARPQVHGHDLYCTAVIRGKGNHRFVSGAEEKVARVFEAPLSFLKTLNHSTSQNSSFSDDFQVDVQILGANMSALGLSQKPIYVNATSERTKDNNENLDTLETIPEAVPVVFTEPPIEEQLAWNTLWPESHKLYGHGNELFSLCCDHEGKLVASSCKAQSASVAEIWLWQVGSWKSLGRLHSHTLTVTQMEFSHDDSFLLSVSRDRHFSVFLINQTGADNITHQLVSRQEGHKRIIWACSWNPFCHEFVTGSRDKMVKIWSVENGASVKLLITLPIFGSPVTALSWVGLNRQQNLGLLAVGMESGLIELWSISHRSEDCFKGLPVASLVTRIDALMCHVSAVHRLTWRMSEKIEDSSTMHLASCGADHCVRIFNINVVVPENVSFHVDLRLLAIPSQCDY